MMLSKVKYCDFMFLWDTNPQNPASCNLLRIVDGLMLRPSYFFVILIVVHWAPLTSPIILKSVFSSVSFLRPLYKFVIIPNLFFFRNNFAMVSWCMPKRLAILRLEYFCAFKFTIRPRSSAVSSPILGLLL